jgi:hypothetical protein
MRRAGPLLAAALLLCGAGASLAQVDVAKALVGRWEGEQQYLVNQKDDPRRTLVISSVEQMDGKWIADARFGTPAQQGRFKIPVEVNGNEVRLLWKGASGADYDLRLMQSKYLVGKVTLTTGQHNSTYGSRDRGLKLEKVN